MLKALPDDHVSADVLAAIAELRAAEEAWALCRDNLRERMRRGRGLTRAEYELASKVLRIQQEGNPWAK